MKSILKIHLPKVILAILLVVNIHELAMGQSEKALLWKISGNGLRQSSYLFGTYHFLSRHHQMFLFYVDYASETLLQSLSLHLAQFSLLDLRGYCLGTPFEKTIPPAEYPRLSLGELKRILPLRNQPWHQLENFHLSSHTHWSG